MISCLSTRRCKRSRKIYKASRTTKEICRRTVSQQKRRCGSSNRRSGKRRSVTSSYRTKSIRTRCRMQKWRQSFRVCRREKKEEAAMLRRQVLAAWRPCGSKLLPCVLQWVRTRTIALANAVLQRFKESGATQGQMPGRDERRRNSADEQGQGRINQQLVLPTPGGINQGAPDLVKAKVQQDQAQERSIQISRTALQWMRRGMTMWEKWCLKQKRKKKSQGKDPKTFEEHSQGRDPRYPIKK